MNKTAHEKLIEKGFEEIPRYVERYYILDNDKQYIEIYINIKDVYYYIPNNEYVDLELSRILTQYLEELVEKAQKQEKLLGLYKEINNKRKELIALARYDKWAWKLEIEINEIQDKIKELENE